MKEGLTLDAILALDEAQIRQTFPLGAVSTGKRWKPAETEKEAEKTLARLLRDKRARQEKPRYPVQSGPQRLRWSAKEQRWVVKDFEGDEEHGYTTNRTRSLDGVEAVYRDVQDKQTQEAAEAWDKEHAEDQARATVRAVLAGLRQIGIDAAKSGADPRLAIALAATKMLETEKEAA